MTNYMTVTEIVPGVRAQKGLQFSAVAAEQYFSPLVGKTIKGVLLIKDDESYNSDEESYNPQILLEFEGGGVAFILADEEGNGPGFIQYEAE